MAERLSDEEVAYRAAIERGMGAKLVRQMAYRGKKGCTDWNCTIGPGAPDYCYGWHCSACDAPCSMMGHDCPVPTDAEDES